MNPPPEKHPPISPSDSGSDQEEEEFFQLASSALSKKPPSPPFLPQNEIGLSAKRIGPKPPDPNRIPMSVFAANASPKEWSVASNESLFSIRMGNSSFSREQGMFLMGRSGDLGLGGFTSGILEYAPPQRVQVVKGKEEEEEEEEMVRQSDCSSATSFGSFAFPVLASEGKSESIKVMSRQYAEYQPPPLINPLNAPTTKPTPPFASAKRRWFPCFSWCQFCS